jgi:hypothetical protein
MEERGVRTRVNTSQAYIWQDAVQYATYPTAATYTDSQVGDFVKFDASGNLVRSSTGGSAGVSEYQGIIVGIAPDSGEYPAFGAPFNRPLVALLSPNKSELIMREIDASGNYVATPSLKAGDLTKFVYNSTTKRWGVQAKGGTDTATGRVAQVLSDGRLLIVFGG